MRIVFQRHDAETGSRTASAIRAAETSNNWKLVRSRSCFWSSYASAAPNICLPVSFIVQIRRRCTRVFRTRALGITSDYHRFRFAPFITLITGAPDGTIFGLITLTLSTNKINVIDVLSPTAAKGINPFQSQSPLSAAINRILALRALVRSLRFKTIADNKQRSQREIQRASHDASNATTYRSYDGSYRSRHNYVPRNVSASFAIVSRHRFSISITAIKQRRFYFDCPELKAETDRQA